MKYNKTSTVILLSASIIKSIFTGKANRSPQIPPRSIVAIVLTTNVGDMIFATSVFRAIKEKYPTTHIAVVGSKKNAITLSGNNDVDQYIENPGNIWKLIRTLKEIKADYGFSLTTSPFDIAGMFLSGFKTIACFNVENAPKAHTKAYNILKNLCIQVPYYIGKYCSQEYLRILEPINIFSTNTHKYLFYSEQTMKTVKEKYLQKGIDLSKEKIAVISPGAGTKTKLWPVDRFAQVSIFLIKQGFRIAVIGGPGDREEVTQFKSKLEDRGIIDASDLSLEEMIYFISICKLIVANDSGPVYMAEAFGVATLVVVGPTDEFEHPPHGPMNVVVTPNRDKDAPEMRGHIVGYSEERAREQIERVTVKEVLIVLRDLLQRMDK